MNKSHQDVTIAPNLRQMDTTPMCPPMYQGDTTPLTYKPSLVWKQTYNQQKLGKRNGWEQRQHVSHFPASVIATGCTDRFMTRRSGLSPTREATQRWKKAKGVLNFYKPVGWCLILIFHVVNLVFFLRSTQNEEL